MSSNITSQLSELEALRGNPVILYTSIINDESVRILYECLRKRGKTERLDLVLSTMGGVITTTHQLALLLREFTQNLTILVPYRAKSSGTLLCLSANELILGPMAELGPVDPHIGSLGTPPPDSPGMISAQDIRVFREMAENWFGVTREEDRIQVLALVAQRIFPTSLSSFYRHDQLVQQIANELLVYQLPNIEASRRQEIVDQLVKGYYSHDYIISRSEVLKLGLKARFTSPQEEVLLWDLLQATRVRMAESPSQIDEEVIGLIASTYFSASLVSHWIDTPPWQRSKTRDRDASQPEKIKQFRWDIEA